MTFNEWAAAIETACLQPDGAASNALITQVHYLLSNAIADAIGREAGPNFHSWAVWGSRKAGVTIRQEDLGDAIRNATVTAGVVGCLVGLAAGVFLGRRRWNANAITGSMGAAIGTAAGAWTGRQIAIWSRQRAAHLVLEGNRIVLRDIGIQSARFLQLLQGPQETWRRDEFFAGLRTGATEQGGQDCLATAFRSYLEAFDSDDIQLKSEAMIVGNCQIVYHEHIRLEPYIQRAMPYIIRRCATQRLMTFDVGPTVLSVANNLPGIDVPIGARNWARIEDRMRYIFALFREFHCAPQVFNSPDCGLADA